MSTQGHEYEQDDRYNFLHLKQNLIRGQITAQSPEKEQFHQTVFFNLTY
jgi:hypothetical protein